MTDSRTSTDTDTGRHLFGTFAGVFTPSILTIVGIILFLRTGYVVGQVGLASTLIIMAAAFTLCLITGLSLAVIATDIKVKEGGFYYVISRTLGPAFGGALGLTLFLSISISVAFYVMGLVDVLSNVVALPPWLSPRALAGAVMLVLFVFAWLGADWTTKLQFFIMALVASGLAAFFFGGSQAFNQHTFTENWAVNASTEQFWLAFALFFPAITGFTQGLNMSGDLKAPHRAIPLGTFAAIAVSGVLYVLVALVLAGSGSRSELTQNYYIMADVALWPAVVSSAVIAATLSSAMASLLGAPRVLQAMAEDKLIRALTPFAKADGKDNNPRRAVIAATAIALLCVIIGDLNLLAPIISMFFLAAYALLNYATFFALHANSPFFRPRFKWSHKVISLVGGIGCVAAMLAINLVAAVIAVAVLFALHQYLARSHQHRSFTDHQRGVLFKRIRDLLFEMNALESRPGDWRPHMLVFSRDPDHQSQLLKFSVLLEGQSGLTTLTRIINPDDPHEPVQQDVLEQYQQAIVQAKVSAFTLVTQAADFRAGLRQILNVYGIGPIRPNTAILHWPADWSDSAQQSHTDFAANCREVINANMNLVALACQQRDLFAGEGVSESRKVDIWWRGGPSARLLLMFAYLCTRSAGWQQTKLRILTEAERYPKQQVQDIFATYLEKVRIESQVEALDKVDLDVIARYSAQADLVFFPMQVKEDDIVDSFGIGLEKIIAALPNLVLVQASKSMQLDPDPDDANGKHREGDK